MRALTLTALAIAMTALGCGVSTYRGALVHGSLQMRLVAEEGGEEVPRWFGGEPERLEAEVLIDESQVREVQVENQPDGSEPHLVLYLDAAGTNRLAAVTSANPDRRLAIVVDGRVVVAPTIRSPITEGEAHITVGPTNDVNEVFDALTRIRRSP